MEEHKSSTTKETVHSDGVEYLAVPKNNDSKGDFSHSDVLSMNANRAKKFKKELSEAESCYVFQSIADDISQEGDKKWAKEIYAKAIEEAKKSNHFVSVAESVASEDYLGDKEWAKEIYAKAIEEAKTSVDFVSVADSVAREDCLGDKEWAKEIYAKAIEEAEDSWDFAEVAESVAREDCLGDKEWCRKLIQQSTDFARTAADYNNIAGIVAEKLEDKSWARDLYQKAENLAKESHELKWLATHIVNILADKAWAQRIYKKALEATDDPGEIEDIEEKMLSDGCQRNKEIIPGENLKDKHRITFDQNDVYLISSITINNKVIGSEGLEPSLWVKGEKWEWIQVQDSEDYYTNSIYVFNRLDGFNVFQSDDGMKSGLREVNISYKKIKSNVMMNNMGLKNITANNIETNELSCTYNDILANDFMIAGQFILHQKNGQDEFGILGEKNPWSEYPAETNRKIFIASDSESDECQLEFESMKSLEFGEDGEEQIESGEFAGKNMFRFWGRCEGNVNEIEFGEDETEPPKLFGNFSMDYAEVITWDK